MSTFPILTRRRFNVLSISYRRVFTTIETLLIYRVIVTRNSLSTFSLVCSLANVFAGPYRRFVLARLSIYGVAGLRLPIYNGLQLFRFFQGRLRGLFHLKNGMSLVTSFFRRGTIRGLLSSIHSYNCHSGSANLAGNFYHFFIITFRGVGQVFRNAGGYNLYGSNQ